MEECLKYFSFFLFHECRNDSRLQYMTIQKYIEILEDIYKTSLRKSMTSWWRSYCFRGLFKCLFGISIYCYYDNGGEEQRRNEESIDKTEGDGRGPEEEQGLCKWIIRRKEGIESVMEW